MSTTATVVEAPPLDRWIAGRLGIPAQKLMHSAVAAFQLQAVQEAIAWACAHSSFHARHLADLACLPRSFDEFEQLPFTNPEDVAAHPHEFLCVPQDEIARVVTLQSSGTTGERKRVFFTAADQELALDFFAHGVSVMARPGDRMLIALPGEREGSVGFQLAKGIARAGVIPIPHGLAADTTATLLKMEQERVTCLIGLPVQVLALALSPLAVSAFRRLRSIVLCSDHVPDAIVAELERVCEAEVFEHYGSTEMGLGGGVDCEAHAGYHLREVDLYFEIVSPKTGKPLPDGELGEVIFTTLNRKAMPLIRYRTGDLSRIVPGPCECGSVLRRLEKVKDRVDSFVSLGDSGTVSISMLDEALFAVPGILDFGASLVDGRPPELRIAINARGANPHLIDAVRRALVTIPAIRRACTTGNLQLEIVRTHSFPSVDGAKRKIEVRQAK